MEISAWARFIFGLCAAVATLAGCSVGGIAGQPVRPGLLRVSAPDPVELSAAHYVAQAVHRDRAESWMFSAAKMKPLVYVSDWSTGDVFVYNYLNGTEVGRLTDFNIPYGQCVDADRNVWITEFDGLDIVEYAHGGKSPLQRLATDGHPVGCSFDPLTGNLAVANFYTNGGSGNLQVWKHAAGAPTTYRSSRLYYLWPPAYDDKGNVFVEGRVYRGAYGVAELVKYGIALRNISLKGTSIRFAGAALWDGAHLGLTDQDSAGDKTTVIDRTTISGATGTVFGRVHLVDSCNQGYVDVVAPFAVPNGDKQSLFVIGGNIGCTRRFDYWKYPPGGDPHFSLPAAPAQPFGQSLSPASE